MGRPDGLIQNTDFTATREIAVRARHSRPVLSRNHAIDWPASQVRAASMSMASSVTAAAAP